MSYEGVIEDLKLNIYSATDAFYTVMNVIREIAMKARETTDLVRELYTFSKLAIEARPTSALLLNGIREVIRATLATIREGGGLGEVKNTLLSTVQNLVNNIENANALVAQFMAKRVEDGDTIMTHSYSRVVLQAMRYVVSEGKRIRVIVTESRPGDEGHKMAEDIASLGIETVLIVDSAARYFMKEVDKVLIGSEAVAANGAVINKVGTSQIALAAHEARVRVFVAAITWKISPETVFGELVRIAEKRPESFIPPEKLSMWAGKVEVHAPLYDVTPPEYIDAIITERGLVAPQAIIFIVRELYGWPPRRFEEIFTLLEELRKYGC